MRPNISHVSNLPMGANLAFKNLVILLNSELASLKAKDSINIHLTSRSDTILFVAEVNHCKKKKSQWPGGGGIHL